MNLKTSTFTLLVCFLVSGCILDNSSMDTPTDSIALTSIYKSSGSESDSTKLYCVKFDYELSSVDYANFNIEISTDNGVTFKVVDSTQYKRGKGSSGTYLQVTKSTQGKVNYGQLMFSIMNSDGTTKILATTSPFILP